MDMKQPLSLFLVAILAASAFSVIGITSLPLQKVSAQDVTIETSADDHDGAFFGGLLQVIIEDEDTDDDDDTIDVEVTVESDEGSEATETFTIDDTSDGSQRFEFFLAHTDADDIDPDDPDAAVEQVFLFGEAALDLDVADMALYDSGSIEIQYGDEDPITIDYDESSGQLSVDRTTSYGTTSIVHLMITDQDGNLDPTAVETLTIAEADVADLLDITGASIPDDVDFEETSDNSAIFEAEIQLIADAEGATDPELVFDEEVVSIELTDMVDYNDAGFDDAENDSTDTDEVTIEIDDQDGDMDTIGDLTFGGEIVVSVTDDDQNVDSENDDTIVDGLAVEVGNGCTIADAADCEDEIDLEETDDNTGLFEIDANNNELRITFLDDGTDPTDNNGILEFRAEDIEEDILIEYIDPEADDDADDDTAVVSFTVEISLTPGSLSAPETTGVNDEFTVTLTDPDLNDNPRIVDSYTLELTGTGPFPLTKAGDDYSEIYEFDLELDGDALDFGGDLDSITISETGINTGIFELEIDMEFIADSGNGGDELIIDDGSDLEVQIDDFMADVDDPDEDDVSITIGKPDVAIDFSRDNMPIPPEDDSVTEDGVGTTMITTLIVTDPSRADQSNVEETFDLDFSDDETPGTFVLEIEGDDVNDLTIEDLDGSADSYFGIDADCDGSGADDEAEIVDGVSLCEVFTFEELEETGEATGVFEAELSFTMDGLGTDMTADDWQDAEFTFNYFDDEGEEESGGFTFRGNDGIVTVDQPSAKSGTPITIVVEDNDLNLDDAEIDSFESGDLGDGALLLIETEDDEIAGIDDDTFHETGEDTGIFEATFVIGEDIPISDLVDDEIEQATNVLITFDDEIDSTGGGGDELEVNVPIVSGTGSLQVTPELVGPATTLTILVIDSDLDEDADSIDDYDSTDPNGDDFFISFGSDRSEVNEGSPDLEETGPNTGVFMFELELITDEEACQDDDLDAAEFQAEGGDTDSTIGACPGDLISIRYEDELTGGGGSTTVSEVVEVQAFDPEFVADKDSYAVGDRVTVTISDPDANRDSDIADSLTDIRVRSDSDQVGEELSAIETGRDTGVFRLSFGTTGGTASGSISVNQGDDITVVYTDEFPADFEEEEEDKDFDFVIPVGGGTTDTTTTVTPPEPQDVTGETLDEISAGQQVVLTTNVVNNNAGSQPFVALIEVRDSSGITVYLAWQTGLLPANGQAQVGLSWTAENPGDYTVRTFVISDLASPDVLSKIAETDITVS
jgi:hypothetical protein